MKDITIKRAVNLQDVAQLDFAPVYQLNEEKDVYERLDNKKITYDKDFVEQDDVFTVITLVYIGE